VYGGFTNQFPSEYERRRAFAIATLLMGFLITGVGLIGFFIIEWGKPETFAITAIAVAIVLGVFNIILFTGVSESEEMKQMFLKGFDKAEKKGFWGTMKTALKTKNFVISLAGYTVSITAMQLYGASGAYMLRYVIQVPYAAGLIPTLAGLTAFIIVVPFWSNYARKHGFKKTYWVCFVLHGIAFIPFLFVTDLLMYTVAVFIMYLIYSGEVIMLMPVASDTYDEVSSRMEKRVDATLVGTRTFFFRISVLAQGVIIGVVGILAGFNPAADVQTASAILGIRIHAALIPATLYLVMGLIFKKYYTLEGKEKEALVSKLKDLGIYR
jgi:Na+/melibiose symporter-like transporter